MNISSWVSKNYWKGGWRSRIANILVNVGNRRLRLLPPQMIYSDFGWFIRRWIIRRAVTAAQKRHKE